MREARRKALQGLATLFILLAIAGCAVAPTSEAINKAGAFVVVAAAIVHSLLQLSQLVDARGNGEAGKR